MDKEKIKDFITQFKNGKMQAAKDAVEAIYKDVIADKVADKTGMDKEEILPKDAEAEDKEDKEVDAKGEEGGKEDKEGEE